MLVRGYDSKTLQYDKIDPVLNGKYIVLCSLAPPRPLTLSSAIFAKHTGKLF